MNHLVKKLKPIEYEFNDYFAGYNFNLQLRQLLPQQLKHQLLK